MRDSSRSTAIHGEICRHLRQHIIVVARGEIEFKAENGGLTCEETVNCRDEQLNDLRQTNGRHDIVTLKVS